MKRSPFIRQNVIKKSIPVFVLCIWLFASCAAPQPNSKDIVGETLTFLTANEQSGRVVGSEGGLRAAQYIAGVYAEMSLTAFSGDNFMIEFADQTAEPEAVKPEVTLIDKTGSETRLVEGVDYVYTPPLQNIEFTLPLSLNKAECESGKAVYIAPDRVEAAAFTDGSVERFAISASSDKIPASGYTAKNRTGGVTLFVLDDTACKLLEPGARLSVNMKANVQTDGIARNVAGVFPGANREHAFLILAHYDGSGRYGETLYPSAYDNASGVAAMLRALEIVSEKRSSLPVDVIFLATDGEESGHDGASAFRELLMECYSRVNAINIDCIGHTGREFIDVYTEDNSFGENQLAKALVIEGAELGTRERAEEYSGDGRIFMDREKSISVTLADCVYDEDTPLLHGREDTLELIDASRISATGEFVARFITEHTGALYEYIPSAEPADEDDDAALREAAIEKYDLASDEYVYIPDKSVRQLGTLYFGQTVNSIEALEKIYPRLVIPNTLGDMALKGVEPQLDWMISGIAYTVMVKADDGTDAINLYGQNIPISIFEPEKAMPASALVQYGQLQCCFTLGYANETGDSISLLICTGAYLNDGVDKTDGADAAQLFSNSAFTGIRLYGDAETYYDATLNLPGGQVTMTTNGYEAQAFAEILSEANMPGILESMLP